MRRPRAAALVGVFDELLHEDDVRMGADDEADADLGLRQPRAVGTRDGAEGEGEYFKVVDFL